MVNRTMVLSRGGSQGLSRGFPLDDCSSLKTMLALPVVVKVTGYPS